MWGSLHTSWNWVWDPFFISIPSILSLYRGGNWVQEDWVTLLRTQSEWPRLPALSPFRFCRPGLPPKLWNKCLNALNRHLQFIIIVETLESPLSLYVILATSPVPDEITLLTLGQCSSELVRSRMSLTRMATTPEAGLLAESLSRIWGGNLHFWNSRRWKGGECPTHVPFSNRIQRPGIVGIFLAHFVEIAHLFLGLGHQPEEMAAPRSRAVRRGWGPWW